ncbi:hypothetical protein [Prosthecobacter sp.]|uniref:hypothetical protein n=1 Tax=Prosthecobacter sp. TaxID=1965333 RepID=UPI00378352F8
MKNRFTFDSGANGTTCAFCGCSISATTDKQFPFARRLVTGKHAAEAEARTGNKVYVHHGDPAYPHCWGPQSQTAEQKKRIAHAEIMGMSLREKIRAM